MATFTPRTKEPTIDSSYYYSNNNWFYTNDRPLPNDTTYAFGRFYEITGQVPKLARKKVAADWWSYDSDGYKRGQTPKVGAVVCWAGGPNGNGHVAIVEKVVGDNFYYSESVYSSKIFGIGTAKKSNNYYYASGYSFQGFIYCGINFSNDIATTQTKSKADQILNPTSRNATTKVDAKLIWQFLILKIKNPFGVAGLMGNLFYESGLSSINMENQYEDDLGYTDITYTNAVDKGTYSSDKFGNDRVGYGLAQWTHESRKPKLYNYWKTQGGSIGNVITQLEYLIKELSSSFPTVLKTLKNATSVKEASDIVLHQFEIPADASTSVENARASKGNEYYNLYKSITADSLTSTTTSATTSSTSTNTSSTSTSTNKIDAVTIESQKIQFSLDILAIGETE